MFKDYFNQEMHATLQADDYPVAHHLVHGVRILPGVFLIDMIYRAITRLGLECSDVVLQKITFREPVSLGKDDAPDTNSRRIILIFDGNANHVSVQVISHAAQQSREQARHHLKAELVPAHGKMLFHPSLPERMPMTKDADDVYRFARNVEIVHHEFMKPLGRICHLDHGTFASVELAELAKASMDNFLLQPVFMDFATLVPFSPDAERYTQAYIPIYIERIQVAKPLRDKCRVYTPLRSSSPESDDILYHDIFLYDDEGNIALIFERFGAKRIRHRDLIHALLPDQERTPTVAVSSPGNRQDSLHDNAQPAGVAAEPVSNNDIEAQLQQLIQQLLEDKLGKPGAFVDTDKSFYESGLSSVDLLDFVTQLEHRLDLELYPTLLFEHTSVAQLRDYLLPLLQDSANVGLQPPSPPVMQPSVTDKVDTEKADRLESRPEPVSSQPFQQQLDQPIAIVGIAGQFAQSDDLTQFWQHLNQSHDLVTEIPSDRWDRTTFSADAAEAGKSNSRWGSFIRGVDEFDPLFFAISPLDAERMDPQERQFLQAAWHALEDASMAPGSANHVRNTGVFCGVMWSDYQLFGHEALLNQQPALASSWFSSIPNRVSYCFDFSGPSLPIDTACSSALHAIHLACDSLRRGECQVALAGAVNLSLHPSKYTKLSTLQMLSPTGRCRPFAEEADGYVPGEGVGAVILKPLDQALRDGHHIYGLIRGSAIGHGGKSAGFSVPNHQAQADTFTAALKSAGLQPDGIDYLETHGTGTRVGDPIEVNGITETFRRFGKDSHTPQLFIGSVKSNVGHLEAAAGMASLAKVLLAMHYGQIPKSLYTETLNPLIDFQKSPVIPVQALQPWPDSNHHPRTAAIASFGAGGANSYLILEQYSPSLDTEQDSGPQWIPLSAPGPAQLIMLAQQFANFVKAQPQGFSLARLATSLQLGRKRQTHRLVVLANTVAELYEHLVSFISNEPSSHSVFYYAAQQKQIDSTAVLPQEAQAWLTGKPLTHRIAGQTSFLPFLPGYPFTRKRYWVNSDHKPAPVRLPQLAADHLLLGEPVVPGMYYLNRLIDQHQSTLCAHQLKWLQPLVCDSRHSHTSITAEQLTFSEQGGERQVSYKDQILCRLVISDVNDIDINTHQLALTTARAQCTGSLPVDDFYRQLQQFGIVYGDSLRVIQRIQHTDQAVTVQFKSGVGQHRTALLDGALQATALLLPAATDQQIRLPFFVQSLWLPASMTHTCSATLISVGDHVFDIGFFDTDERLIGLLHRVTLFSSEKATVLQTLARQRQQPWLQFESRWSEAPLPVSELNAKRGVEGITLVFADQLINTDIDQNQNTYWVLPGDTFKVEQPLIYLDERQDQHVAALMDHLRDICKTRRVSVSTLLYQRNHRQGARYGFAILLDLMRAWYRLKQKATVSAVFLYQAQQYADACAVAALAKTAMLELPSFQLKAVAVDHLASSWSIGLSESASSSGVHVRYEGQQRYERRTYAVAPFGSVDRAFKHRGQYIISGGLGGLGRLFATHLLQHYQARILLVGRRPDSADIQAQCQSLQALGGTVSYLSADVGDADDLRRVIATAEQFGPLKGWIHSAGVIRDALLPFKQPQQINDVLAPKVNAVEQLHQVLQGKALDCVVLCSSVSAMLGSKGQADYAAANGFMDGFAEQVSSPAQPWISINWPLWRDGGMQISDSEIAVIEQAGLTILESETGLAMLEQAVGHGGSSYMALTGQQDVLAQRLAQVERHEVSLVQPDQSHASVNMLPSSPVAADSSAILQQLRQTLSDILKLDDDDITVSEPFENYGIDSVQIMSLLEQIEARFNQSITVSEFAELNTLEKLAAHIVADLPSVVPATPPNPAIPPSPATPVAAVQVMQEPVSTPAHSSEANSENNDHVAIISVAGRFPGAASVAELWSALQRPQPAQRVRYGDLCRQRGYPCTAEAEDIPVMALSDSDASHALEFTILEQLMHELIDRSDYTLESLAEKNVGVYLGAGALGRLKDTLELLLPASLASRISHALGLNGPTMVLDSACSSSITALHQACQALRCGEVELACAGAINLLADARIVAAMAAKGMLAKDGISRLFDIKAQGFGLSEGAGLLLLKRFDQAQRDGDNIVAVIRAIGLQNEGKSPSPAMPNVKSLRKLMARTFELSQINTAAIGYVDISGVGDQLIDVLELEAIRHVYESKQAFADCVVTATKSRFGTALSASGLLSLLCSIVAMHKGAIPGQPNIHQLQARLPFSDTQFNPVTETTAWPETTVPRCAVINNMGMGGTHGHVVLQQGSGVLKLSELPQRNETAEPAEMADENQWTATLCQWLESMLELDEPLAPNTTFEQLGLVSFQIAELMTFMEEAMTVSVSPSIFFDNPSIDGLAAHLATQSAVLPAGLAVLAPLAPPNHPSPSQTQQSHASADEHTTNPENKDAVAIIGMAVRLPMADTLDQYWQIIRDGKVLFTPASVSRESLNQGAEHDRTVALLAEVGHFDRRFFGISPREAGLMDPQLRLALETVYHALEDANIVADIRGSETGVFAGITFRDYEHLLRHQGTETVAAHESTGNAASMLANRISYYFNLKGPSIVVDTACSSSLVALHQARNAIRQGECRQAIVLGANLLLSHLHFEHMEALGALSTSGRCSVFDAKADGYVPGEGIVAVVIQATDEHLPTQPPYALIRASAVNHAGKTNSITVPGVGQQQKLLQQCWQNAGVLPEYIETHGTGTPMGDPIEIDAVASAMAQSTQGQNVRPCALGSVKACIGHTEASAGLAGLIKAALVIHQGWLPGQPAFQNLNPKIKLPASLHIPQQGYAWEAAREQRVAAVSSFGFGGANAHALLCGARGQLVTTDDGHSHIFVLSARTQASLYQQAKRLQQYLEQSIEPASLVAIARTLIKGREVFQERLAVIAASIKELTQWLDQFVNQSLSPGLLGQGSAEQESQAREWLTKGIVIPVEPGPMCRLPGYAFDRELCWFKEPDQVEQTANVVEFPSARETGLAFYHDEWLALKTGTVSAAEGSILLCHREATGEISREINAGRLNVPVYELNLQQPLSGIIAARVVKILYIANEQDRLALDQGVMMPLVSLLQRVMQDNGETVVELLYVSLQRSTPANHQMISGLAHAVSGAHPGLSMRCVFGTDSYGDIVKELFADDEAPTNVFYQNSERGYWRKQMINQDGQDHSRGFSRHGTYLVTGGLGSIGQQLCEYLVREYQANLIILGRRPVDDHSQAVCRKFSGTDHDAIYIQADVTDRQAILSAVIYSSQRFGQINAILHAAGKLREGPLANKTVADFNDTCGSKIYGLEHLVEAVQQLNSSPAIYAFSSTSACLPSSQLADYAMANAFMDAKCAALNRQGMPVYSLQLPYWQEGGMKADEITLRFMQRQTGFAPLSSEKGLRAIDRIVGGLAQPVTLIADGDQTKIQQVLNAAPRASTADSPSPVSQLPSKKPQTAAMADFANELLDVIMQVLKLSERPETSVSLTELGFESITVIELTRDLQQRFGLDVSGADLYSYQTLGEYLGYLQSQYEQTSHLMQSEAATARAAKAHDMHTEVPAKQTVPGQGAVQIVGMAARLPGAESLQQFWQNQLAGVDVIRAEFPSRMVGQQQPRHQGGGFIDQVESFDAAFFNMTRGQAEQTDPQQRLLLQCCWHALEDAGVVPEQLNGHKVGVFIGVSNIEYREVLAAYQSHNGHNVSGTSMSMAANRLSYFFNWTGPSETVDTGCSSSLVALHRARKAMADGDCDWAIVGGVNLLLSRDSFKACEDAGMLSPDQRCFTFDQRANGYVRAEGVGVVFLKSDRVNIPVAAPYATLKNTAVNHNGKGQSLTAPSALAQSELLQRIYEQPDVDLNALHYIECHGTATELGDPIEINALKLAFSALNRWPARCALGTVKSHIGHLESAAGIAGIIRIALSLFYEKRPGNLHFEQLNPHIKLAGTPFYVQQQNEDWSADQARIAGVSSFGFGGVNGHALLAGHPALLTQTEVHPGPLLFVWSASTVESLQQTMDGFSRWLTQPSAGINLYDVAMTLLRHRQAQKYRAVVEVTDLPQLQTSLQQWLADQSGPVQCSGSAFDLSGWHYADIAAQWLQGQAIQSLLPNAAYQVVRLPGYVFATTRCWPDEAAVTAPAPVSVAPVAQEAAKAKVASEADIRSLIRQVFAEITRQPISADTSDQYFDNMAIDSITGLALIDRLASHFGPVSKTLLFEYKTITELTAYFSSRALAIQPEAAEQAVNEPADRIETDSIAVIGMAGKFATAEDVEALWQLMQAGECGVREVPEARFDWREIYGDPTADERKTNCKWGGFIDQVERFDPAFFGISPREAEAMDPQQRLFLIGCYQAIENAGYRASALNGQRGGVFAGVSALDYSQVASRAGQSCSMHVASGLAHTVVANRVSYFFGLNGPSEIVDTACSSSLVSIHRAITALQQGECDFALAGGVNLTLTEDLFVAFGQSGFLSPTGRCHSFSDQADGYVRGEGYGIVMLKPLELARRDGDQVLAVVRASGVNHGGRVRSLSVPNPTAQADLVHRVWQKAGVQPSDIDYIEAHGTGTPLGDPIEVEGLKKACREFTASTGADRSIGIGALKANIGHLESAAGVAGLIKVLLCMRQQQLPAIAGFTKANPYLELDGSPLYLLDQPQPWPAVADRPRIAALSSFGFGGTNAHMVIQAVDDTVPADLSPEGEVFYLPVSAHDDVLLRQYLQTLLQFFTLLPAARRPTIRQFAYVFQSVHDPREVRVIFKAKDSAGFCQQITSYLSGDHTVTEQSDMLQAWLQGSTDDWPEALRTDEPTQRFAIPSRSFGGERYWYDAATPITTKAQITEEERNWQDVLERLARGEMDLDESSEAIQL